MKKTVISGLMNINGDVRKGYIIADQSTGLIEDVKMGSEYNGGFEGEIYHYNEGVISSGDFNAHSHPEQSIYTDIVDKSWDLSTWCRNTIYKYSVLLKPEHIYYACCRAFSRMLKRGVTSVMVSFYCHNKRGNELDREVIRAAKDTGIRLYFGRMNYDIINSDAYEAKRESQQSYYENVKDAEKYFMELAGEENDSNIVIAPSVHSIHASTKDAIINAINLGNRYGRFIQFHLSEDKGDVDLSLKLYGKRPISFLTGLVDNGYVEGLENVILSDCVHIDDEERELIKKYNMKVVLNPRMNDRIKTGEADIRKFVESGILPYLGTDGEASNDDLSITGEKDFIKKRYKDIPENIIDSFGSSRLKFNEGYIGGIQKGNYCDLKIIKDGSVNDVFVSGRKVVCNRKLSSMDYCNDIEKPLLELADKLFY